MNTPNNPTPQSQQFFHDLLNKKSKNQQIKWYYRFLWWCAGADQKLLSKCETDHEKYLGIGLTILLTGILACISGAFAIATLIEEIPYVIAMGLFWGFIIFNLDRFVVLSITKENNLRKEVFAAFPRLLLAIIIAVVISTPIEIALFKTQIDYQIEKDALTRKNDIVEQNVKIHNLGGLQTEQEKMELAVEQLDSLRYTEPIDPDYQQLKLEYQTAKKNHDNTVNEYKPKINQNRKEIADIQTNPRYKHKVDKLVPHPTIPNANLATVEEEIKPEWNNRIILLRSENRKHQQKIDVKRTVLNQLTQEVNSARKKYEKNMEKQIAQSRERATQIQEEFAQKDSLKNIDVERGIKASAKYSQGFFARLEALHNLGVNEDGTTNSMYWARWMIWLLFVVIETAPIFVKLVVKQGAYDRALAMKAQYEVLNVEKSLKRNLSR